MPSLCGLCGPLPVLSDVPREEVTVQRSTAHAAARMRSLKQYAHAPCAGEIAVRAQHAAKRRPPHCARYAASWSSSSSTLPRLVPDAHSVAACSAFAAPCCVLRAGLFARADTRNTNGRVYPRRLLRREVARFVRQHIAAGTALGELNHPSYSSRYFRVLNLPNISHQVSQQQAAGATVDSSS